METVDLREMQDRLKEMPLMVEMHPLSLAFLPEEVRVFTDAWEMIDELDSPLPQVTKPMLCLHTDPSLQHRLPMLRCFHDPLTTKLNDVLLKRYDLVRRYILHQSQLADKIVSSADADAVCLILVDGLAYEDIKRHAPEWLKHTTPVLVDGVSNTEQGMVRIVGKPTLAQRLSPIGLSSCMGFTYWERPEEPLTDRLFFGFGDRVYKVKSFGQVIETLSSANLQRTFVQIVRAGLDGAAHRQREQPDVGSMVKGVLRDLECVAEVFGKQGVRANVFLTSDHGILWAHEHRLQVYEVSSEPHPRHYEHAKHGKHVLTVGFEGKEFALLEYPYLRRELRGTEWGVHGGLSYEESIVPLICLRTP